LAVNFTYNGSTIAPTSAGSYTVIGVIDDANYQGSATNTLVINVRSLAVTNSLAMSKVYDGTTNVLLNAADIGLSGVAAGDSLTLVLDSATAGFADKNVGCNKPVTVTGLALSGAASVNYSLSAPIILAANITAATLTLTANNTNKLVGADNPPLSASYCGFVGGEDTNALSSLAVLSTAATTASTAGTYPISANGASAANYAIQYVNGILKVILDTQVTGAQVTVNGPGQYLVSWPTITGQTYQLEYEDDLDFNTWQPVGTPLPGIDGIVTVTNNLAVSSSRFFRVRVQ
jgi:hypothetical protein